MPRLRLNSFGPRALIDVDRTFPIACIDLKRMGANLRPNFDRVRPYTFPVGVLRPVTSDENGILLIGHPGDTKSSFLSCQ